MVKYSLLIQCLLKALVVPDAGGRKRKAIEFPVAKAEGLKVRPLWLIVSHTERYLMLEDVDTGDVLLPLIYMKVLAFSPRNWISRSGISFLAFQSMFEANYSRKLSSLKHRIVALPERFAGDKRGFVYWQWAFESPHEVKVLVRKMLGEENTPQGHLRLILVPIVFNAMAQKAKLREVKVSSFLTNQYDLTPLLYCFSVAFSRNWRPLFAPQRIGLF